MDRNAQHIPISWQMPRNEFTDHCTGDMHDMDVTYHHWLQDRWNKERAAYNAKQGIINKPQENHET